MYYIGIDIGKQHHEASIVDSSGNLISKSLKFSSNYKGADKLIVTTPTMQVQGKRYIRRLYIG